MGSAGAYPPLAEVPRGDLPFRISISMEGAGSASASFIFPGDAFRYNQYTKDMAKVGSRIILEQGSRKVVPRDRLGFSGKSTPQCLDGSFRFLLIQKERKIDYFTCLPIASVNGR